MFTDTVHEAVTGIAVSHDGNCILASCLDNSMRLLDKASGEQLASYTGMAGPHTVAHTARSDSCCAPLPSHLQISWLLQAGQLSDVHQLVCIWLSVSSTLNFCPLKLGEIFS